MKTKKACDAGSGKRFKPKGGSRLPTTAYGNPAGSAQQQTIKTLLHYMKHALA